MNEAMKPARADSAPPVLHLAMPGNFEPAIGLGSHYPRKISGQPASYFWKDVIRTGQYALPGGAGTLSVDKSRLRQWAETGRKMLGAGVRIPINCDHSDKARDVVGYVKEMKLQGDRLLALCQFIGDDACVLAARNQASAGIHRDFVDGQNRRWGDSIVHVALTPMPVVPDQGEFVQAASLVATPQPDESGEQNAPDEPDEPDEPDPAKEPEEPDEPRKLDQPDAADAPDASDGLDEPDEQSAPAQTHLSL